MKKYMKNTRHKVKTKWYRDERYNLENTKIKKIISVGFFL